jgi:predicted Zn finger-like uncharacterized protein
MPEEKHTRCPGCATVFRVTREQLEMRAGQVRCGRCKTVFDGVAQRISLAPPIDPDEVAMEFDEAVLGPPPVPGTLRNAQAVEPSPRIPAERPGTSAGDDVTEIPYEDRFPAATDRKSRRVRVVAYAVAIVLLLSLIAAQAIFHFRDAIAAYWPATRPPLERICDVAGCAIHPLRDGAMSYLSIEASDLQADPAHRGLLVLTATLRSRAGWSVSYPHLELTLTDAQDRVVVRRVLAPADYAGGTADLLRGIGPNGEVAFKVFIDASATAQAGYRLYMFYP